MLQAKTTLQSQLTELQQTHAELQSQSQTKQLEVNASVEKTAQAEEREKVLQSQLSNLRQECEALRQTLEQDQTTRHQAVQVRKLVLKACPDSCEPSIKPTPEQVFP